MDELNITPQPESDKPDSQTTNDSFSLGNEQKANPAPSIDPAPNVESGLLQPESSKPVTPPVVEEPLTTDSVLTDGETPKKGGIPKWAMIAGGIVGLGVIVVGAMFATNNWPFKGQLNPDLLENVKFAAPEYCPDGQYYDAGEIMLQQRQSAEMQTVESKPIEMQTVESKKRLLNAIPAAKAARDDTVNNTDSKGIMAIPKSREVINEPITDPQFSIGAAGSTTYEIATEPQAQNESVSFEKPSEPQAQNESLPSSVMKAETYKSSIIEPEASKAYESSVVEPEAYKSTVIESETHKSSVVEPEPPKTYESSVMESPELKKAEPMKSSDLRTAESGSLKSGTLKGNTTTLDTTKCKPIPPTDCELINKLLESPQAYFISPATLKNLNDWKVQNCTEKIIPTITPEITVKTCGENQELVASRNECACKPGYFELESSTTQSNTTEVTNQVGNDNNLRVNTTPQKECINCKELQDRIETLKTRLTSLDYLEKSADQQSTQKAVVQAEIDRLEAKAKEENCVEDKIPLLTLETKTCDELVAEVVKIQGYPSAATTPEVAQELASLVAQTKEQGCEIPEKNVCVEHAEQASNKISLGDFTGSFNEQIAYIDASCIRELNPCEAKLAYATVAKEYSNFTAAKDDANFFDQEFTTRRDDYMDDLACVLDKPKRCTEIESQLAEGYTFNSQGNLTQSLALDISTEKSILTLDQPKQSNLITGADLPRESNLLSQTNLDQRITENLESGRILNDKEYQDLYCQPFVALRTDDVDPAALVKDTALPESPLNPPVDPAANPPVSAPSNPPEDPALNLTPTSDPVPNEELAASAPENNFQAPAAPGEPELVTTTTELNPAAPEESLIATPEAPLEAAEITDSPLITKTGPETFIFFFAFIASQIYYFRRRIYAFVEKK